MRSKRALDLIVAAGLLLVLLPLVLLVLVAFALDVALAPPDRGPLLYREPRVSRGRTFGLLKFRTLRADVLEHAVGHARLLEADPANLTWLGRRLLKPWYLDEVPQLLNVLRVGYLERTRTLSSWELVRYDLEILARTIGVIARGQGLSY